MPKKPTAEERTVPMFAEPAPHQDAREVEVLEQEAKAERLSLEEDVDRLRTNAFKVQEWCTKYFGLPEADGNEYRLSKRDGVYFLQTLKKLPGGQTVYGHTGVIIHERDLMSVTKVLVQAVRELQKNG